MDDKSLVYSYVLINGVIEIDKLLEILKEHHNLNITKKELLEEYIVEGIYVIGKKYLGLLNFSDEQLDLVKLMKKQNSDYRIIDNDFVNKYVEFFSKLEETVNKKDMSLILAYIVFMVCMNLYNDDNFEDFCNQNKVKKETIQKLKKVIREYKNIVPIWSFNGYSITEQNKMKKKKVGRNDPCPCGSGKKYKKCCGR